MEVSVYYDEEYKSLKQHIQEILSRRYDSISETGLFQSILEHVADHYGEDKYLPLDSKYYIQEKRISVNSTLNDGVECNHIAMEALRHKVVNMKLVCEQMEQKLCHAQNQTFIMLNTAATLRDELAGLQMNRSVASAFLAHFVSTSEEEHLLATNELNDTYLDKLERCLSLKESLTLMPADQVLR
jgi:hypothetical protein